MSAILSSLLLAILVSPGCGESVEEFGCAEGEKLCDGRCVRTDNPAFGCAEPQCDPCDLPNADLQCSATGACVRGDCSVGWADCLPDDLNRPETNGCETHLRTSPRHCGQCTNDCARQLGPNTTAAACSNGTCAVGGCLRGFVDCDGITENGCEVHSSSDTSNCGACGKACPVDQICVNGECREG